MTFQRYLNRSTVASLPEIARFVLPNDGDMHAFTVLIRDEDGTIVYTATLTFAGIALNSAAIS